ncbi:hypothetical protein DMC47_30805 [Nostoc sp. 3335mG]|nr:hypothetical protein DMC47_30805 [Nostoc sp. 3335mG]
MSVEAIAAAASQGAVTPPPVDTIQAGPSASIADQASFQGSLTAAQSIVGPAGADALAPAMKAVFSQLEQVNGEAKNVAATAKAAEAKGTELSPGEVVQLTMRCHEFMFHCQLTSSIANRTSDGIQQLFRQQS